MAADREEAELRALLGEAEAALARAVMEAGLAAAACAVLAGEYAAVLAAGRRLPPGPVLAEAARVLRRRGEAVHRALRPAAEAGEEEASGTGEDDAGDDGGADPTGRVRSPRRRPSQTGREPYAAPYAAEEPHDGPTIPSWLGLGLWPSFRRWRQLPLGDRGVTPSPSSAASRGAALRA